MFSRARVLRAERESQRNPFFLPEKHSHRMIALSRPLAVNASLIGLFPIFLQRQTLHNPKPRHALHSNERQVVDLR